MAGERKQGKHYNPKIVKLEWYLGYDEPGRHKKRKVKDYVRAKGLGSASKMIEESVKKQHPDLEI